MKQGKQILTYAKATLLIKGGDNWYGNATALLLSPLFSSVLKLLKTWCFVLCLITQVC